MKLLLIRDRGTAGVVTLPVKRLLALGLVIVLAVAMLASEDAELRERLRKFREEQSAAALASELT